MSKFIQNILTTRGWKEIEDIFTSLIAELRDADINPETPSKEYKINDLSNRQTVKFLKDLLKNIKTAGSEIEKKKISYK